MSGYVPVFEGEHLRAALYPGTRPVLMVTLDFRRVTRKGFSEANNSSSFARQGYAQLSITCKVNDWFINADTPALERALAPVAARYARVQALGYSMGGYGAFRFARALGLTGVVAVSPQATIAPGAVPGDRRYAAEAATFDAALGDLAPRGRDDLEGIICVDPFKGIDLAHARLIRQSFPRVRLVPLAFGGHPASRILRAAGKAWLLQREAAAEVQTGAAIRDAHRAARRDSPLYWAALAEATRRPALAAHARAAMAACAERDAAARAAFRAQQVENTRRNRERAEGGAPAAGTPPGAVHGAGDAGESG